MKAVNNLVLFGIQYLVVIGGDGSLTGAELLKSEWPTHLQSLASTDVIKPIELHNLRDFQVVGLVGSIDNDMIGTDLTIGAISGLTRICESVDNIYSTALSHSRVFVVEVMGRHCGWLALMATIWYFYLVMDLFW